MSLKCKICKKTFKSGRGVKMHKCVTEPTIFECKSCDFSTDRKQTLDRHTEVCKSKVKMEKMIAKIETLENDLAEVTEKLEKEVLKTKELSETLLESRSNNNKKDTQIANIRQENHEMMREVDRLSGMVKVYKRWKGVIPKEKLPSPKVIEKIYEEDWTDK